MTRNGWILRKKRHGSSGCKNPLERSNRMSISMKKWHMDVGFTEETKQRIGRANAISLKGKLYPNSGQFKPGESHRFYKNGEHIRWNQRARNIMKKAGFDIEGMDVHHINHNQTDNRLENLMLMIPSEHYRYHLMVRRGEMKKGELI